MAAITAKGSRQEHKPSGIDHVLVSQASREDARPASFLAFDTYSDEHRSLVAKKQAIEGRLGSEFSDLDHTPGKRRHELQGQRIALIEEKRSIEARIAEIKHHVKRERFMENQFNDAPAWSVAILHELREIKELMIGLCKSAQANGQDEDSFAPTPGATP